MGCACCKSRVQPFPLQKPGTSLLPPLQMGTMAAPDLVILGLQAEATQRSVSIKALEEATVKLQRQVQEYILSASPLKSEILVSRKDLDNVKSRLSRHKAKLEAAESIRGSVTVEDIHQQYATTHSSEISSDLIELDNIDNDRTEFTQRLSAPKEEEKTLFSESKILKNNWNEALTDIKRLVQSVMQLQGDLNTHLAHAVRSNTMVGQGVDVLKEEKMEGEAKLLESSVLRLLESAQRHLQILQEDRRKIKLSKEMQALLEGMAHDSALLRKELEGLQGNSPFEVVVEEQVIGGEMLAPVQVQEASISEGEEMQVDVEFEPEVMVAAEPPDAMESFHSSSPSHFKDLTAYEAFDLFDAALLSSDESVLPKHSVTSYLSSQKWEEGMYDLWLSTIYKYANESLPYAELILSVLQEGNDPLPSPAAGVFPRVINACNKLVQVVEADKLVDNSDLTELGKTEEADKTLNTGGMMYWVDCLDMVHSVMTPTLGTRVIQALKPDRVTLPDYITFQICHKMHKQHTDGMNIFHQLDTDHSGKLNAEEFSKGLIGLLGLWIEEQDVTSTFQSLYNKWSGQVSKIQFSKQVNFEEYIGKTRGDMATIAKYRVLSQLNPLANTELKAACSF